ncbi:MAG: NAD(+) diphosphatase [Lentisphaeria bacterium]
MLETWQFRVGVYSKYACKPEDPCLLYNSEGELLLNPQSGELLHACGYQGLLSSRPQDSAFLGTWGGRPLYAVSSQELEPSASGRLVSLREVLAFHEPEQGCLACMGKQLLHWRQQTRYCSACASPLQEKQGERARICPACQELYYPRINPAVIVSVAKDDRILLAHNRNFPGNTFSLVAGYVEVGESLEQAVAREVLEEVGLHIKNIRYWGSQPWPFPSSLMLGFQADYESGQLNPDGEEIDQAGWYTLDELPNLPRPGSIARKIIDSLLAEKKQ